MPIARFQMPDGRIARFEVPVGTSPEQAQSLFDSFIAQQQQQQQAPRKDVGILESGIGGVKKLLSSQLTALESPFGAEAAAQRGAARARKLEQETPSALSLEAVKKKYAEEGIFPAAGEVLRQAPSFIAEQSPQLAEAFAGGRLGAMAGSPFGPLGTLVGGTAGALAPGFLQAYGGGAERRAELGLTQDPSKTAASAALQTGAEGLALGFTFGGKMLGRILGIGEKEAAQALVNPATRALAEESLKKAIAKGGARGVAAELPTEVTQQMLDRWQADLPLLSNEAFKEYEEAAYGATLFGTPLGGAGRIAQRGQARGEVAAAEALQAEKDRAAAAEAQRVADEELAAKRADPAYILDVGSRFDALKQQEKELLAARGKKLPKNATDEQREAFEAQTEELKALREQLKELAPEYNAVKPRLAAAREELRVSGLTPEEYFAEVQGYKREEKEAKPPVEEDAMQSWMDQTAAADERPLTQLEQEFDEALGGLRHFNMMTPVDVADVVSRDPVLMQKVYSGDLKVPEFNRKQMQEVKDALKLQIKDLASQMAAGREGAAETRETVEAETEALRRIGEKPVTSTDTEMRLGSELADVAEGMKPGVAVEPGLKTREYEAAAEGFNSKANDAINDLRYVATKLGSAEAQGVSNEARALRSYLTNKFTLHRGSYIDAALQEIANTRAAQGQQPLSTDTATKAAVEFARIADELAKQKRIVNERGLKKELDELKEKYASVGRVPSLDQLLEAQRNAKTGEELEAINALLKRRDLPKPFKARVGEIVSKYQKEADKTYTSAVEDILARMDAVRTQYINYRPTLKREEAVIRRQVQPAEAEKIAEARGETTKTLEGQLRRQRDYVGGLLERALPTIEQTLSREDSAILNRAQAAIENNTATRELLDSVEDIASRALRGQSITGDVAALQEPLRSMEEVREEREGQRDLFGERAVGGKGELGFIRASASNFQKFLASAQVAALRRTLANARRAALGEAAVPGVDIEFYRKRIDAIEEQIAEVKNNLEDIGGANWESAMQTQLLPEEGYIARQKLYALLQERNALEMAAEEAADQARKQRLSGTRGPYEAAQAEDKARKLKDQIRSKETNILTTLRDLTAQIRAQRGQAIYGPIVQQFERNAQVFEARLAELKASMPEDARMSPELDEMFNEAAALEQEIKVTREGLEEARFRASRIISYDPEFNKEALEAAEQTLLARQSELRTAKQKSMSASRIAELERQVEEAKGKIDNLKKQRRETGKEFAEGDTRNEALLAAADERIVKEKAKLKELQDKLAKVDLVGDARRQAQAEATKKRGEIAVAEKLLATAKEENNKKAEAQKQRIQTGEGMLKLKRTVVPVIRQSKKTGKKVYVVQKGTGLPVRQKKTEGAYAEREPVKGVNWGKPAKKSVPVTKVRQLSLEDDATIRENYRERIRDAVREGDTKTADKLRAELKTLITPDEPVAKAQRVGAAENVADFAQVAGTLARQANVTDVKPRPQNKKPLRIAQGRDAAARFAKDDLKVQAVKAQYGARSEQYKKALRDAEGRYFEKIGTEFEAGTPISYDGTAYRIGEAVENAVDAEQAQALADKVKAKLPKGIKFVYAKDLLNAPGKFLKAMARDGLDVNTSKVKGGVLPDGTVVVIGNHHSSLLDLEKTIAHELGHYGTDTLLGKEGMDALYNALDKADGGILGVARKLGVEEDVMDAARAAAERYQAAKERGASKAELDAIQKEGQQRALREMLAHVEEAAVDKGFLAKASDFIKAMVGAVRAALRKMGLAELAKASTSDIYYVLRKARQGVYNDTLGAYRSPSGETAFRTGQAVYAPGANPAFAAFNAKTGVAPTEGTNKVFSNVTGLGARTALIDRFAPLKEVASYLKNSAEAMQMMYYARMHDQRMAFTSTTATNGARTIAQDEKGNYYIKDAGTASLKDVSEELAKVKGLGNSAAVRDAFDAYLKAYRAKRVGGRVLNFEKPPTTAEIESTIAAGDAIPEFVAARKMYNEYNKGLINWLVQAGAISKGLGAQLSSTNDYVPFYRVQGDDVLFEIGDRTPIVIGDVKNQPYLKELVGGKEDTKDFFTAALQNTALLTDMGLRNLATKQVAFTLQSAGLLNGKVNEKTGKTKGIVKGTGPASPEVIRFKIDGVPHYARVDTDAVGVPAELLVQGLHGTVTQMGGFVKLMSIPARFMRAMITRNPMYSARQVVRDSTTNYLLTGGNTKPLISALGELQDMWSGKSKGYKELQEQGVLGGQIISGTSEDMQKIMLQLVSGKPGWEQALAKLDRMAMMADASSRVALYNDFRKQGLSHMEATLAALEAMNFSKRGTSGTLYKLNMMVPFLNAQIQGLNVLWEAFTGKLPYAEALKQKQKFYTRAAMMSALTLAYAGMMADDEAYENADMRTRLQNWFIRIPGVKDPIKVPIPFEAGLIFKALPEALALMSQKDKDSREVLKALGGMVAMSSPVGVSTQPQAIKPIIEAAMNKSFFTGRDLESAQEQELLPTERVRAGTSELAKLFSSATGGTVSPIMIEHFVNGYSGSMGLAIMQAANAILPTDREAPAKRLSEMPVIGSMFQATDAPGQITSMYERAKRYEQIKNTFDKYVDEGRGAEAQALAQRYGREIVFADIAEDFKKDVGEFTTLEKQIRASALSAEEKTERLKEIRQAKIALSKTFNAAALSE